MRLLALILLLSLGLSGCQAKVTAVTNIEDDGSGSSSLQLSVGPELAGLLEEGGGGEDIFQPIEQAFAGWTVESGREPDDTRWLRATREFASLQELQGRQGNASAGADGADGAAG